MSSKYRGIDLVTDGWFAQARGGADFFTSAEIAVRLQLEYSHTELDQESAYCYYLGFGSPSFGCTKFTNEIQTDAVALSAGLVIFPKWGARKKPGNSLDD